CASSVIFEGAQGLLLDQQLGAFPYVTRSNTGLANMLAVAGEAGIDRIEAVYVTRCYLTRHGRGPMPNENDIARTFAVDDATNLPNAWQESLRFGELDLDLLGRTVRRDARLARSTGCEVVTHLAVTCLDQALGPIPFRRGGERRREGEAMFVRDAAAAVQAAAVATSHGPTRSAVNLDGLIGERRAAA
ncbi:MAG: adenylosuccinate synthetase, partial [Hyphomicrobiaceae bacterium]